MNIRIRVFIYYPVRHKNGKRKENENYKKNRMDIINLTKNPDMRP